MAARVRVRVRLRLRLRVRLGLKVRVRLRVRVRVSDDALLREQQLHDALALLRPEVAEAHLVRVRVRR